MPRHLEDGARPGLAELRRVTRGPVVVPTFDIDVGRIEDVPVPGDCTDGFVSAYETRPEAMLDPHVRAGQSVWARLPAGVEERFERELRADLASGAWDARHPGLREAAWVEGGLRLVVSEPPGS